MRNFAAIRLIKAAIFCCGLLPLFLCGVAKEPEKTGPATEKRFPTLKVPPGFKANLFACDPLIEYPSVISLGPRTGSLFVAIDYMTGLGTEIIRRSEIRLAEDTDGDGYADRAPVFATGFNSIQGMAFDGRTVYVMHAPYLTVVRDRDGDGKADERVDLLTGLGLPPEKNPVRLHCANGVTLGHDGWLYLSLGDHGCDVKRPEGDRLQLVGGGILRCRPDGRDLHIFARGLRNIYDVALDADLNVFVRDNENDGGDYKVRMCHSFFGADHGYPYLYYERPSEALAPLADLGLGSSAGGVCYLERQFPPEFRGDLFFCEWGRAVMRYRPQTEGSGFGPLKEFEFAAAAEKDPYGFKPTDIVVDRDGSMFVSDWADGQRPKRGRGRIYRIRYSENAKPDQRPAIDSITAALAQLESDGDHERLAAQEYLQSRGKIGTDALGRAIAQKKIGVVGRLHGIWIIARGDGQAAIQQMLHMAGNDPSPRVQTQAIRALADLVDPTLSQHRLDAGPGNVDVAKKLAALAARKGATVFREAVIALGRLKWHDVPGWLKGTLKTPDPPLAHAAMQAMRASANWPAILDLLDLPDTEPTRIIALHAVAERFEPEVVNGLIRRLEGEKIAARKMEYADVLTRVHRKPGERKYWGYRPGPRPANSVAWEKTPAIEQALATALLAVDSLSRVTLLARIQREKITMPLAALGKFLAGERQPKNIESILDMIGAHPAMETRPILQAVIADRSYPVSGRLSALTLFVAGLDNASQRRLQDLEPALEDGPVLAAVLVQLGKRPELQAGESLLPRLRSSQAEVCAAALEALGELGPTAKIPGAAEIDKLLKDKSPAVRRAAASAAGKLGMQSIAPAVALLAQDADAKVRRASLEALRLLKEGRATALAVKALADTETQIAALQFLADVGLPTDGKAMAESARRNPSNEAVAVTIRALDRWSNPGSHLEKEIAELQGASGVLARWTVSRPLSAETVTELIAELGKVHPDLRFARSAIGSGPEFRVQFKSEKKRGAPAMLMCSDVTLPEPTGVQFMGGSNLPLRIWLDGQSVFQRPKPGVYQPDSEKFDATLTKGPHRILVEVPADGDLMFHLRFRRKSSKAEHEKLIQAALARSGNPERGRGIFFDAKKSQCSKCHRIGEQGERIGPELTGLGNRFGRIHIIESILDPSRNIAPGFQTVVIALDDGKVLSGIKVGESDGKVILADNQGNKHMLARSRIESEQPQPASTMPEGLERQLTLDEFVDLVGFLASQKGK